MLCITFRALRRCRTARATQCRPLRVTPGLVGLLEAGRRTGIKQLVQASTNAMCEETGPGSRRWRVSSTRRRLIAQTREILQWALLRKPADTYDVIACCLRFCQRLRPAHRLPAARRRRSSATQSAGCTAARTPGFPSDGNQRRDYISWMVDRAGAARRRYRRRGFGAVDVSATRAIPCAGICAIANRLMGEILRAKYCPSSRYWVSTPSCAMRHRHQTGDPGPQEL